MSRPNKKAVIYSLSESGLKFVDPSHDIRGRDIIGRDGKKMGTVSDLLMDDKQSRIRFIEVAHGGFLQVFGRETFILPVNVIQSVEARQVHVNYTNEQVDHKAIYIPELEEGQDTGPVGWFEQGTSGLPGVAIQ